MAYQPQILIDLDSNSVDNGNIVTSFENTTIGAGVTENIYYQVTSPSKAVIKSFDFGTPDGILTLAQPSANMPLVPLPVVANGNYEEGTYKVEFKVEDAAFPGTYIDVFLDFILDVKKQGDDNCIKKGLIGFDIDCFCLKMTVTDQTDYSDVTLVSRELTIVPPTIPNQPAPVNIQTTDPSITFSFEYSGVTYNANLYSVYEHFFTPINTSTTGTFPDVTIRESLDFTQAQKVVCDLNLCKLLKCIDDFFIATKKEAAKLGGLKFLPVQKWEDWQCIENLLIRYQAAAACNNVTQLEKIFAELQEVTGCDCGCGGTSSSDEIVKLVAACSGGSGVDTVNGNAPIIVNVVGSTATISLDPNFVNLVNNGLQELLINTGNNSPNYLEILAGANPNQKLLSFKDDPFKWNAWVVSSDAKMLAVFGVKVNGTPQALRYSTHTLLQRLRIEGTLRVELPTPGSPVCLFDPVAAGGNIFIPVNAGTKSGPTIPCFNANGDCVGSIQLIGVGTPRNLAFTPNNNYIAGEIIITNGTLNLD